MANNPFEIPQQMRDLTEQNLKQAQAAYDQLPDFMTKSMSAWMGAMPSNPAIAGFKDVQDRAVEMAKKNADAAFALADKLSNSKDIQEILACAKSSKVHSRFHPRCTVVFIEGAHPFS